MEPTTKMKCLICQKYFPAKIFSNHQKLHSENKIHPCDLCGRLFITKDGLTKHTNSECKLDNCKKTLVTDNKKFSCYICEKTFWRRRTLTEHERIHTGEKPFECDICEKTFCTNGILTRHKRTHTGEKPYKCDLCVKTFSHSSSLTDHIRIHTGMKPYQCNVCDKTFTQRNSLSQHRLTHTGVKPYKCDICLNTFTSSTSLVWHKKMHTGETPFTCDICEKAFTQRIDLVKHKRVHTGEKPYESDLCGKAFSQSNGLTDHRKIHSVSENLLKNNAHMNMKKCISTENCSNLINYIDCGKDIKVEFIKEEINEEDANGSEVFESDGTISIHQETVCGDIKEEKIDENSVEDPFSNQQEIDRIRLYSCDVCLEKFTERIVLMMHKDINHSQPILQSVEDPIENLDFTGSGVEQDIKEEVKELDEGQGVEDSNFDAY